MFYVVSGVLRSLGDRLNCGRRVTGQLVGRLIGPGSDDWLVGIDR